MCISCDLRTVLGAENVGLQTMPPKAVKRGAASAGSKRNPKSTRGASKSQNPPAEPVEEVANVKETSVPVVGDREEEKEDAIEAGKVVEKSTVEQKVVIEAKGVVEEENAGLNLSSKGSDAMKNEELEEEQDGEKEGDLSDYEDIHEVKVEGDVDANDDVHPGEEVDHAVLDDRDEHDDEGHEVFQERRKHKEFEVFVGGLDNDATEDDIRKVFCQVGEVVEVRLMMNPQTKKNKGFAFLRFATTEQTKCAFTELKNHAINGK
ncbi:hypothetical protein V6N13_070966 [Hibiscus sabdariffa]